MNKDNHSILQDENLREALKQEEAALPQMPADLNDRLMKRLHHEEHRRHFVVWPWVAAACVAAVMVVWLLPPKESSDEAMASSGKLVEQSGSLATERGTEEAKDMERPNTAQESRIANPDTRDCRIANSTERERAVNSNERIINPDTRDRRIANSTERAERAANSDDRIANPDTCDRRIANLTEPDSTEPELAANDEMVPADLPRVQAKPQQVVMTERDIPISRPENYRYTPEEIALMRRQANEAYVKWMELEMEIMKYQYEQIAKQ